MNIPRELLVGYQHFRKEKFAEYAEIYRASAEEQTPRTMVIGCADSRVDPAIIFSAGPGELFVVRNIGALVPPFETSGTYHGTSAAIEFAVLSLKVENIVVLGHGQCGGISASLTITEKRPVGRFIQPWVDIITDLRDELLDRDEPINAQARQNALERMAIQLSMHNLTTFPFVSEALEANRLSLHGAWFSIADAKLRWLDWDSGTFEPIESKTNGLA